jgi:peptide/nickel transport system substrate-binding protein
MLAVIAVVVALAVAACGGSSSNNTSSNASGGSTGGSGSTNSSNVEPGKGGVFNLALSAPQGAINPLETADYNAMFIVGLANAQLVIDNTTGKLVPQLAKSWSASSNGLKWTFKLRSGIKFSNGKPVTPADVVWTIDQIIAPKSSSPAASSFTGILKSVAASGSNAVVFTLDKPYSDFPYLLTGANTWILPSGTNAANWIKDPVGAGQFVLTKYTSGQGVTFKRNPDYWDASAVDLTGIDAKFYSSPQSELLAFQSGETDELTDTPVSQVGSTPHRVDTAGWEKFDGLVFNVTKAPFTNIKVRQAIAWALNRKEIVQSVYQNGAVAGNDVPTFPDAPVQPQGLTQRSANNNKVKSLLAGVKTPITFAITTYTGEQTLAQAIQQQLDATGDFKVTLNVESEGAYYASGSNSPWLSAPATITDWADRLPTQLEALLYAKGAIWNASHYDNPRLDKLTAEYNQTTDASTRQTLANQIAKIQWTDVPVIVPAFEKNVLILSPKVKGTFVNGQNFNGGFDFRGISVSS